MFTAGQAAGVAYYTMPFIAAQSLRDEAGHDLSDRFLMRPHPATSPTLRLVRLWLIGFNCLSIVLGLCLAFTFSSPLFSGYRKSLANAFWGANAVPESAAAYVSWSMALIGAATVGWATTNLFVVIYALGRGERWPLLALGLGSVAWAALEIVVSLAAGAHIEIYFVTAALAGVVVPVVIAWRAAAVDDSSSTGPDVGAARPSGPTHQ